MNPRTIKWLAVAAVALLALMFVVERANRTDTVAGGDFLLPGFKDQLNDVNKLVVTDFTGDSSITILRDGERWTVEEKDSFPADTGTLRETLLALADARQLEQKTANPDRLPQLGLGGPDSGEGTKVDVYGDGFNYSLIIGNEAQSKNRYVRMADEDQAWLIDRNPDLAESAAGWLVADLLDIDATRIRSVSVTHSDGESIHLDKAASSDSNFVVSEIPEGRELSYATVANGIAGVLKGLEMEDVRRAVEGETVSKTVFTTFDGLVVTVSRFGQASPVADEDVEEFWFAIDAAFETPAVDTAADAEGETGEVAIDDTSDEESAGESGEATAEKQAAEIDAQHDGWQYRLPGYKANLIARRWADILKAEDTE